MYFLNGSHFSKFLYVALLSTWLNLEPSYLAQLCIYTGATYREEIMHVSIIFLKLRIFFKISHFALFGSFGIHVKDTNFTFGTPHTHIYRYTQTHAYIQTKIQVPFSHFALSDSLSIHSKYIWHTTDLHMHRHSDICTETLTHRYRYTETRACLYTYTNTHTDVHVGNLRKLLLEVSISISGNANSGYSVFQ